MLDENDYFIEALIDELEFDKIFKHTKNLIGCTLFILNPDGQLPEMSKTKVIETYSQSEKIIQEIKEAYKVFLKSSNITNTLFQTKAGNSHIYLQEIQIYNNIFGYFGIIFQNKKIDLEKANSIFFFITEILKTKYESIDLIKDNITHYKQMNFLSLINEGALYASSLDEIYRRTLNIALDAAKGKIGLIFSLNEEERILELIEILPKPEKENEGFALFLDDNIFAKSIKRMSSIILNNVNEQEDFVHPLPFLKPDNYLIIPLVIKVNALGLIVICEKKEGKDFNSMDQKILKSIASQAAITVENQKLFFKLKENFIKTIEALSAAIDMKDTFTIGHSHRVSNIALAIADEMGIKNERILEDIKIGALLHDIGKIGIPSEILYKPSFPSPGEWEIIRKHPVNGTEIVKSLDGFEGILPTIKSHHERWDGKGYPENIKGEEIPLPTRIVSVADAYDTIISKRPYKDPYTSEEALEGIKNASGTQFDPNVVEAFIKAYKKGLIIKKGGE